jgi:hypothetical protein
MPLPQGQQINIPIFVAQSSQPTLGLAGLVFGAGGTSVQISKKGGAKAAWSATGQADLGNGDYYITLSAAETNLALAEGEVGHLLVIVDGGPSSVQPAQRLVFEVQNKGFGSLTATEHTAISSAVAAAVGALAVEGSRTLIGAMRLISARLFGKSQVPTTPAGGTISAQDAADTKARLVGSISSTGAINWTTLDDA